MERQTYSMDDVKAKMKKLGVIGYSGLGRFTPDEHMKHLNEIECRKSRRHQFIEKVKTSRNSD